MRILIIEDDLNLGRMLALNFKAACFAVDCTGCGNHGLSLAKTHSYDLIILDYHLPNKNGFDICKELRENALTTPIVMISVQSETETKIKFLDVGADDYVQKPFSFDELTARAKAILRRPKQIIHPKITIGKMVIDANRQIVTCGNKDIYLTRKEFGILEYLARHRGTVVTRSMIMDHVWNMDGDPFSNAIEAHILNLRKKLTDEDHTLITTVPGRGYKISEYA